MTETLLIPRDQPLEPGRKLRFTFTISYDVPVNDDLLQGEPAATLDDVEDWLGPDEGALWRTLHGNYDYEVVEHEVALADVNKTLEDSPSPGFPYEVRFEQPWEWQVRQGGSTAGDEVLRRSRTWLDEIPAPNVGASA